MKAIILAGGAGLRLRKVIKDLPKSMAPISGRPFLEYLILQLKKWEIEEVILSIGYKGEVIKSFFGNGKKWGVEIIYCEEKQPLGTAGALRQAVNLTSDREFFSLNGDSFVDLDYNQIVAYHRQKGAVATIGLVGVNEVSRYGKVEINKDGKILRFREKSAARAGFINAGVYFFAREVIKDIPERKVSIEKEIFPRLVGRGLYGFVTKGFFVDIGVPKDYLSLCNNPKPFMWAVRV